MSLKAINQIIESEVLVVGSGLAGSMATIKSHQLGNKVVVANKGPLCGGGATSIIGGKTMNVCFELKKAFEVKSLLLNTEIILKASY